MKKVLIITYYWPPTGGGGVQRWLKFVKYIREFGWEPIIYTPLNGESPVVDETLLDEIPEDVLTLKSKIWEPYSFYKIITGRKQNQRIYSGLINEKKEGFFQKLSVFIRGNFFIPDARKFWIKPAVKDLKSKIASLEVDLIISTGPPHSTHLIAQGVLKNLSIPWIADFRDPWTKIDFYDQLRLTSWGDKRHKKLELKVLNTASKVVTVSKSWVKDFEEICKRSDIELITNGYDPEDFNNSSVDLDSKFSICHVGSMNKDRNPVVLWKALSSLLSKKGLMDSLEIKLIGQIDFSVMESLEQEGLKKFVTQIPHLAHKKAINELRKSQLLLLPINNTPNVAGVIPGKLFEYLAAKRPIICIGPEYCDSADIVRKTNAGEVFDYVQTDKLTQFISNSFDKYQINNLHQLSKNIEDYSRKKLIGDYCKMMDEITKP